MAVVGEEGGVLDAFLCVVIGELGKSLFDGAGHVVGVEVGEIEGRIATDFRETGHSGAENRLSPLHGFDDRQPEAFSERGEE